MLSKENGIRQSTLLVLGKPPTLLESQVIFWGVFTLALLVWQVYPMSEIGRGLFSRPVDILIAVWEIAVGDSHYKSGDPLLHDHFYASLKRVFPGLVLGSLAGVVAALILAVFPIVGSTVGKVLPLAFATSRLSLFYVFLVWFGLGETSKFAIAFWTSGLYQLVLIFHTARRMLHNNDRQTDSLGADLVDRAVVAGANRSKLIRFVLVPFVLPQIFLGLRLSSSSVWTALVFIETTGTARGMGYLIWVAHTNFHIAGVFAFTLLLAFCNLGTWSVIKALESRILHWGKEMPM